MWITLLFCATAGLFLLWTAATLWHLRWVHRLPAAQPALPLLPPEPASAPRELCSVVVAARDEKARIEQTVRGLFAQQSVEIELIVVDDRSGDGTSAILQRLAGEFPQLQLKRVDVLPEGWLGKCHACHLGASQARGEWILFTDADCWLKPDLLARTLAVARREAADHLTLISGMKAGSRSWQGSHLLFLISIVNWISGVNRDRPKSYIGIGAFNLVRASAYRQSGGYALLRLTVLDDMRLGLLLRRAGKRTRAFLGGPDVECYWGTTAWDMVKLLEKNYFAALDYRTPIVVVGTIFVLSLFAILSAGLFSGTAAGLVTGLSPLSIILPALLLARRLNWPWTGALYVPFMLPFFVYTLLNSTFVTLRHGGIRWRETFYPLSQLRSGNVQ